MTPSPAEPQDIWWEDALSHFGHFLGLNDFSSKEGAHSLHNFEIGNRRWILDIECYKEQVAMAVLYELPNHKIGDGMKALLTACHFEHYLPFVLQPGLKGDNTLITTVKFNRNNIHEMAPAFELICQLYEKVQKQLT